jgi:hypothetical protein
MFKWALPAILVALVSASGCCCGGPNAPCGPCGPFGRGLICKPGYGIDCRARGCGPTCGPSCGPSCGPDAPCCKPSLTCSPCGGGLKYWLNGRCYCGPSCCERYWGEWISDPPYCCDPCNQCGHFVGPKCCGPGPLMRLWSAITCPHGSCCGGPGIGYGACRGCATGCSSCSGGVPYASGSILHENWDHPRPTPPSGKNIHQAGQPTPAVRSVQRSVSSPAPIPARSAVISQPPGGMTMRR